uniref:Troponin I n=1 Tax=Schistocephalus solidus TaxID=70667 RepID=A0A0X3NY02_SCHSO
MSDDENRNSESSSEEESEEETKRQKEQEERRRREEEAAAERQKKQEEKMKREAEEAAKKPRKPGQKRKGLGGLSPEKKKLLKQLIMQKAADEMRNEMKRRQEEKENYLRSKVQPLSLDGLDDAAVIKKIKELYERMKALEGEKYDWEVKIRRQDFEINELTIKVNDVKGKFVKPVLKKVSKTENMARFEKKESQSLASFRSQLKSTGQNKFALEEKDEGAHKPEWRDQLKPTSEEAAAKAEGEAKE